LDEKTVTLEVPAHDALEYAEVVPEVVSRWNGGAVIELTVHNHMVTPIRNPQVSFSLNGSLAEVWNGNIVVSQAPYHQLRLDEEIIATGDSGRCRVKVYLTNDVLPEQYRVLTTLPGPSTAPVSPDNVDSNNDLDDYHLLTTLIPDYDEFDRVMEVRDVSSVWGEENTHIIPGTTTPDRERGFRTTVKEGTSSNGDNGVGGTGFDFNFQGYTTAILAYRIRFEAGFDFVKGGKLPGLAGGDTPSGGQSAENGFSMRLMWREEGYGEVYHYGPYRENHYGDSIGRGNFRFEAGRWMNIMQQIVLNTIGPDGTPNADGILRLWVDGKLVIESTSMVYRNKPEVLISALMYTIFFGGTGEEWRTPRDQYIDTSNYEIYVL